MPTMDLTDDIFARAEYYQKVSNKNMRLRTKNVCRTPSTVNVDMASRLLQKLPQTFKFSLTSDLTCGGMSRIFETSCPKTLVKVSDISRGFSAYEPHGYRLLKDAEIPCANVMYCAMVDGYMIIVVQKYHSTVSSIIKSVAHNALYLDVVATNLKLLLLHLQRADVVFCDLSPDNIMVDLPNKKIVLIDPQFAIPLSEFEQYVGHVWANSFDTVHLALKIQAIGLVEDDPSIKAAANALSCILLEKSSPPSPSYVTKWLKTDVPLGLRIAYTILTRINKMSSYKKQK